jgi:hypothetical protein
LTYVEPSPESTIWDGSVFICTRLLLLQPSDGKVQTVTVTGGGVVDGGEAGAVVGTVAGGGGLRRRAA